MYKNILVATDDSDNAKRAVEHAIQLAKMNPASTIELVYVVDPGNTKSNLFYNWNSEEVFNKYKKRLQESEKMIQEANVSYNVAILLGFPGLEIVEHANKNPFDLVVIGSRGLNVLQEFVLGSVSHKVAKLVNCPVLIIK